MGNLFSSDDDYSGLDGKRRNKGAWGLLGTGIRLTNLATFGMVIAILVYSKKTYERDFSQNTLLTGKPNIDWGMGCSHENVNGVVTEYNFAIVGAGGGGSILADELAKVLQFNIVVLEMGPDQGPNLVTDMPAVFPMMWGTDPLFNGPDWKYLGQIPVLQPGHDFAELRYKLKNTSDPTGVSFYGYPRGSGNGGSTMHNAMAWVWSDRDRQDKIAKAAGDDQWNYDNMAPYYRAIENFAGVEADSTSRGTSGPISCLQTPMDDMALRIVNGMRHAYAGKTIPVVATLNGDGGRGDGITMYEVAINRNGKRSYVWADSLDAKTKRQTNVKIINNALVTKLIFDPLDPTRVIGVEYSVTPHAHEADTLYNPNTPLNPVRTILVKNEVILCAGVFDSPAILDRSGIGDPAELIAAGITPRITNMHVGKNLIDHPEFIVNFQMRNYPNIPSPFTSMAARAGYDPAIFSELVEMFKNGLVTETGTSKSIRMDLYANDADMDNPKIAPDVHVYSANTFFPALDVKEWFGTYITNPRSRWPAFDPSAVFYAFVMEVIEPRSVGSARIVSSDPRRQMVIDENIHHPIDNMKLANVTMRFRTAMQYMQQNDKLCVDNHVIIDELIPGPQYDTVAKIADYINKNSAYGHHAMGTCAMGKVVTSELKVIGTKGLRIADASIFPTMPSGNPTAPITAAARKCADLIKKDYGCAIHKPI